MYTTRLRVWDRGWIRLVTLAALTFAAACGGSNTLSPSTDSPTSAAPGDSATSPADSSTVPDSAATPSDSTGLPSVTVLAAGNQPGIVFGSYGMDASNLNTVHTGSLRGGGITETNILQFLAAFKAKGARMVLKMCMGKDSYVKNPDGTFSLTKWKALVDRFRKVDLSPYIADGTLMGHFLIDEPQRAAKWGQPISQATVEAMAQYSKQIWPTLPTLVRVAPSWLASAPVSYNALDAGWLQFGDGKGDPAAMVASEIAIAKQKGLGLVVGLNILDGGNGSSGVHGYTRGKWAMSATEIRNNGTALLKQDYACGFYNWAFDYFGPSYYARTDIQAAMAYLSDQARAHTRTSCRQ